jgi:hypothetical protein
VHKYLKKNENEKLFSHTSQNGEVLKAREIKIQNIISLTAFFKE